MLRNVTCRWCNWSFISNKYVMTHFYIFLFINLKKLLDINVKVVKDTGNSNKHVISTNRKGGEKSKKIYQFLH